MSTATQEPTLRHTDHPNTVVFTNHRTNTKRIGSVNVYHKEAESLWKDKKYVVSDVITGDLFAILVSEVIPVCDRDAKIDNLPLDLVIDIAWRERWEEQAQKVNDALTRFGVGAKFSIGVADGSANYVVTKVNKKTCVVAWRGFGADDYYDHHFGGGGTFPIADVSRYCRFGRDKLFPRIPLGNSGFLSWAELVKQKLVPEGLE